MSGPIEKRDRKLDDHSVVLKSKKQADLVNERRLQLEMMLQWQQELKQQKDKELGAICNFWESEATGFSINENGKQTLKKLVRRYGTKAVLDAMQTATEQYLKYKEDGNVTQESWEEAFYKVGGILRVNKEAEKNPLIKKENESKSSSQSNDQSSAPNQPLDPATEEFGNKVDLGMFLQETYGFSEEETNRVVDVLGPLHESFRSFIEETYDDPDYPPTSLTDLVAEYLQSDRFLALMPIDFKNEQPLANINVFLFERLERDVPFAYFSGSHVQTLLFGNKRHHQQFVKILEAWRVGDCTAFSYVQTKIDHAHWHVQSLIHMAILNMMQEEFQHQGAQVDEKTIRRILKYYPYNDILMALFHWTSQPTTEGKDVPDGAPKETITRENFLLHLSMWGNPNHETIIREGNAEDFMEIYRDCGQFGTAFKFHKGILVSLDAKSWTEYMAEIEEIQKRAQAN